MGKDYGISDMYLFTVARWLESDEVDPKNFPKVLDHRERMLDNPAVSSVLESEGLKS